MIELPRACVSIEIGNHEKVLILIHAGRSKTTPHVQREAASFGDSGVFVRRKRKKASTLLSKDRIHSLTAKGKLLPQFLVTAVQETVFSLQPKTTTVGVEGLDERL